MVKTATALRSGDYHSIFIIYYLMPFNLSALPSLMSLQRVCSKGREGTSSSLGQCLDTSNRIKAPGMEKGLGKALEPFYDMGQAQSAPMRALRVAL